MIDIEGPLGAHDPIRTTLHAHLMATAAEQQAELAGSGGYIWQLVGAAKDWIDGNVPADIATRKAGQAAVGGSNHGAMAGVDQLLPGQQGVGLAAAAAAAAAAAGNSGSGGSSIPWWESEDVDLQLVAKATAEAAAAHWASWSVSQEDNPWGNDADEAGAAAAAGGAGTTASTSTSSGSAEALAAAGDGVRGRWDYVVALVGKPSSGKSTTLNAITGVYVHKGLHVCVHDVMCGCCMWLCRLSFNCRRLPSIAQASENPLECVRLKPELYAQCPNSRLTCCDPSTYLHPLPQHIVAAA